MDPIIKYTIRTSPCNSCFRILFMTLVPKQLKISNIRFFFTPNVVMSQIGPNLLIQYQQYTFPFEHNKCIIIVRIYAI